MSGRRKVRVDQHEGWVFNRMADVYDARPAYPAPLLARLVALAGGAGAHVADLGAGIGHLALPLAARGLHVTALEPAQAMLARLRDAARAQGLPLCCLHAAAEALPLAPASQQLVLVADALHFLDAALTGREIGRVLAPGGALCVIMAELGDTPFMRALVGLMEEAAPRRPRATAQTMRQVFALAGAVRGEPELFEDEHTLDAPSLERVLRSISYIGPAMNPARFEAFWQRVLALPGPLRWARRFTLHHGRRA